MDIHVSWATAGSIWYWRAGNLCQKAGAHGHAVANRFACAYGDPRGNADPSHGNAGSVSYPIDIPYTLTDYDRRDNAYAIGYALGYTYTITSAIANSLGRAIDYTDAIANSIGGANAIGNTHSSRANADGIG